MRRLEAAVGFMLPGIVFLLSGCGVLPSAGPSSGELSGSDAVSVVDVTPQQAQTLADEVAHAQASTIQSALGSLSAVPHANRFAFSPGDSFHLTIFTISPWFGGTGASLGGAGVPSSVDLGSYTVSAQGIVILPYIGSMPIEGLDLEAAQSTIAGRFAALGILQNPSAKIDVGFSPRSNIIVTGALGAPRSIPWSPGGITLAEAITQALGNGADILGSSGGDSADRSAIDVSVFRGPEAAIKLPMQTALEHQIALLPGDRIVVSRKPTVRIVVLGGGVSKDGNYEYARNPTLATVLAQASGLDTNVANNRAVFVLEPRGAGQKPVLYDFAWNRSAGLVASQVFPLRDGDLVYVDEALIVPIQRVVDTLFGVAAVANLAK